MTERQQLEQAIAAQESLRGTLDDDIIDATIATLKEKLTALDPPSHQRKLATILFTDIVGSTRLTQGMDPEEQMALIDPLVQRLAARVSEHGGHVCRYQGDGFKAVFGLPVAHENDPAQAIRAGLAIQTEADKIAKELEAQCDLSGFQVRVGLTTGLVFSGGETEGEDTIKGEPVNLAARLESAAQPGTVLISHDSYKHVRGIFDVQPLEPIEAKGFSEPVVVYRVDRVKPISFYRGMRGVEGVETRMVGRELEFLQLQKILEDVIEEQEGQMVTVVGAAGLGKSRLLYEFENWAELLPDRIRLFKGRARLETQGQPYGLLRNLFAFRFGIQEDDDLQTVRDKLVTGFGECFEKGDGEKKAHIIGQLLGYDFQDSPHLKGVLDYPQQLRDQAVMYIADYFQALAKRRTILVLLEDLHWADDASLDSLNSLAFELIDRPICILTTARHGLLERRPHWGEGQNFHQSILLKALSKRESRKLVAEVLQRVNDVPEILRELVVGNAEGNPFYVEELVKMLLEDGIIVREEPHWRVETGRLEEVHVPSTLTGVLQARLDGLPEEERKTLQGASVVGRVFWDQILEHINGSLENRITDRGVSDVLDELRARELIFRRETSAFAEAREHIFKHALLREVTYESVLKRVRQAYHALVADWLIEHTGDREGEFTGLIADHLELAGNQKQAEQYLFQAGKQAAEKFANEEAVLYLSRALNLTGETDSEVQYKILKERVQVYDVIGNREAQEADLTVLESLAELLADKTKIAETALLRARFAELIDDYQISMHAAKKAVGIAREIGDLEMETSGYLTWGRSHLWKHQLDQATNKFEKALELAQDIDNHQLVGHALRNLGIIAGYKNNFNLAINYHQECLALYRQIGDRISEITALNNLGSYFFYEAEFVKALKNHEETLATSREIGHKVLEKSSLYNLGEIYRFFGEYDQAWDSYQQCLSIDRQLQTDLGITETLWGLGCIAVSKKEYLVARKLAEEGLAIAQKAESLAFQSGHQMNLGMAFIGLEKWSEAEELFEKSLDLLVKIDAQVYNIWRWAGLAHLYLAQGLLDKAIEQANLILVDQESNKIKVRDYYSIYPLEACCQVLQAANDSRYPEVLETTYNQVQNMAQKITDEDLRNSFLNNFWIQGICEMREAEQKNKKGNQL